MPPLFITFEGLDGSGKSTHLRRASEWLTQRGVPHVVTHEPGGTPLGDALRAVFLDRRWGAMDGVVELLLVFASRRQHLIEVIEPALRAGRHVLCDRFTDSTRAYQGYGRGVPLAVIDQVDRLATGERRPDRTLLFDLPAEAARARGHSLSRQGRGEVDRLDAEDLAFYERVRGGFLAMAQRDGRVPGDRLRGAGQGDRGAAARDPRRSVSPGNGGAVNLPAALDSARRGTLYPAVILDGGVAAARRSAALELARTLLCEAPAAARPCGVCRHCRRIVWPDAAVAGTQFHPDFQVLERDLKASTSVDATRELLRTAQVSPFEARGQVFVIASAESLTGEAANALLKNARGALRLGAAQLLPARPLAARPAAHPAQPLARRLPWPRRAGRSRGGRAPGPRLLRGRRGLGREPFSGVPALGGGGPRRGRRLGGPALGPPLGDRGGGRAPLPRHRGGGGRAARPAGPCRGAPRRPGLRLRGITAERILEGLVARHLAT